MGRLVCHFWRLERLNANEAPRKMELAQDEVLESETPGEKLATTEIVASNCVKAAISDYALSITSPSPTPPFHHSSGQSLLLDDKL